MKSSVGFIGVGNMGGRMAQRVHDAGHPLIVCDRNDEALRRFAAQGVHTTREPADCMDADLVLVVVATDEQLLSIALGDGGLRTGLVAGRAPLLAVMSTVMPESVVRVQDELRPFGVRVIDAPISGGLHGAAEGTLAIMVGGEEADYDEAKPVLECMGRQLFHCGALGSGEVTKIVNNLVGVTNLYLVAEAYQLAMRHGLDLAKVAPVMDAGSGRTFMTRDIATAREQYAAWADSRAAFDSLGDIIRKDLQLASKLAARADLRTPVLDGAIASLADIPQSAFERWTEIARSADEATR